MFNIFICFEWKTDQSNFIIFAWVGDRKKKQNHNQKPDYKKSLQFTWKGFYKGT